MAYTNRVSTRYGISLAEVLTAIGIMSLLLALLLPAIQQTRETARRTQCSSNLHQIMLAHHQYLDVYGVFPSFEGHFHLKIAPYIEVPSTDTNAKTSLYTCPTDALATGEIRRGWFCSYFGNTGLRRKGYRGVGDGYSGGYLLTGSNGIYTDSQDIYISDGDIKDGLSNTAAVSERLAVPYFIIHDVNWDEYSHLRDRLILLTDNHFDDQHLKEMADDCEFHAGIPRVRQLQFQHYNHILPPNHNTCTNGLPFDSFMNFPVTARSLHPGGVNLAMADGSVRFASENISRDVWWAIGTRNGSETVGLGK